MRLLVAFAVAGCAPRAPDSGGPGVPEVREAVIRVAPPDLDFGLLGLGCGRAERTVFVENAGTGAAVFDAVAIGSEVFLEEGGAVLLAPGDIAAFVVAFEPSTLGVHGGGLWIVADGRSVTIPLSGAVGQGLDAYEEVFVQPDSVPTDVLLVIDVSDSMRGDPTFTELPEEAVTAMRDWRRAGFDFHLGVVSADATDPSTVGAILRGVFTRDAGPEGELRALLAGLQPIAGPDADHGLRAARAALEDPPTAGSNEGFRRDDAALVVLFVSDEDDGSPGTVREWTRWLDALPPGSGRTEAHAVIAPETDPGCELFDDADPAVRYREAVRATGGAESSYCAAPDTGLLGALRLPTGLRFELPLRAEPRASTLEVRLDGSSLPYGTIDGFSLGSGVLRVHGDAVGTYGSVHTVRYEGTPWCPAP